MDSEINYFKNILNPKIQNFMIEAHSNRLIGQFIAVYKRKFIEKNLQTLTQNDMDKVFEEVYGGIQDWPVFTDDEDLVDSDSQSSN
ncbi:MAG: hypothetical protein ACQBVK_00005 [Candidatus Phytoplasma sp. TWB_XP]